MANVGDRIKLRQGNDTGLIVAVWQRDPLPTFYKVQWDDDAEAFGLLYEHEYCDGGGETVNCLIPFVCIGLITLGIWLMVVNARNAKNVRTIIISIE